MTGAAGVAGVAFRRRSGRRCRRQRGLPRTRSRCRGAWDGSGAGVAPRARATVQSAHPTPLALTFRLTDAIEPATRMPAEPTAPQTVTRLLAQVRGGDAAALDQLLPLVYAELHYIAERHMSGERRDHTLQPTALVNEAFLRLVGGTPGGIQRPHPFPARRLECDAPCAGRLRSQAACGEAGRWWRQRHAR